MSKHRLISLYKLFSKSWKKEVATLQIELKFLDSKPPVDFNTGLQYRLILEILLKIHILIPQV